MKIVGSSKQEGTPKPDNPVQITNETVLIITDKEGNKKEMPFKYEKILKEGDKIEKINEEWCLVRRKPMNEEEKKAIERIDYIQDFIIENGQYNADVNDMQYFSKVLNVIKKQSKEIEELIQRNKDLEEIEQEHKEENGRLRDRIKELEKQYKILEVEKLRYNIQYLESDISQTPDTAMVYYSMKNCLETLREEKIKLETELQELLEENEK